MITSNNSQKAGDKPHSKIGKRTRLIIVCLLSFYALTGWLRLNESLRFWGYLLELKLWPRPLYLAITGGAIGILFTLVIFLYVFKSKAASVCNRWLGILFLIWFWVDRIWLSSREAFYNQQIISFFITFVTFIWTFILVRKKDFPHRQKVQEENGQQTGTGSQILSKQP